MISVDKIKENLKLIAELTDEETEKYLPLMEAKVSVYANAEISEEDEQRLAMLAAAEVNYQIALASDGTGSVTSFKAGDVSITESNRSLDSAKTLAESMEKDCRDLAEDGSFVFRTV